MNILILAILPLLAQSFVVVPQDELLSGYKSTRTLLTPEQHEFLMELLAADDAIIAEATSRGIVDDILQALSGAGNSNIRVNIIGGGAQQTQQQPQGNVPAASASPPLTLINPTFQVVSNPMGQQEKALINASDISSSTPGSAPSSGSVPASSGASPSTPSVGNGTFYQMTTAQASSNTTTIGGTNNHLFSTISQVIRNSNTRNVTGIVDQSLRIATPAPIREFVTGILQVVYCNGIRRLLGRC